MSFFDLSEYIPAVCDEKFEALIAQLRRAIHENTDKLKNVQLERSRAEKDIKQCTQEMEQRMMMVVEMGGAADMLQEWGQLQQEKDHLFEELNALQSPAAKARRKRGLSKTLKDLREMPECLMEKERSLNTQLLQVKQSIPEAQARCLEAKTELQTLNQSSTNKPKRIQRKRK